MVYTIKQLTPQKIPSLHRMYNALSKSSKRNFQPGFLGKPTGLKWLLGQLAILASCAGVLRKLLICLYPHAAFFPIVALNNKGEIIGFAFLKLKGNTRGRSSADLGVAVADNYCDIGIGSDLVNRLIEIAKEQKITTVSPLFLSDNLKAIRLYHKYRFEFTRKIIKVGEYEYLEMNLTLD